MPNSTRQARTTSVTASSSRPATARSASSRSPVSSRAASSAGSSRPSRSMPASASASSASVRVSTCCCRPGPSRGLPSARLPSAAKPCLPNSAPSRVRPSAAASEYMPKESLMETPASPAEAPRPVDSGRGPRLREIPIRLMVPNLITVLAICAGLTGIRLAFEGRYELAVAMVLLAAFLDGIDGRVARLLKASSRFGVQMDSLADIINFGVAPALVSYAFLLDHARSFGWIAALIYAIAAGLRLARFNVMEERQEKAPWQSEFFVGVPAPLGAVLVLLPVYLGFLGVDPSPVFVYGSVAYTILIGYLLVSRL